MLAPRWLWPPGPSVLGPGITALAPAKWRGPRLPSGANCRLPVWLLTGVWGASLSSRIRATWLTASDGLGRLTLRAGPPDGEHADLWAALWAAGGGREVLARWAPAHREAPAPPCSLPPIGLVMLGLTLWRLSPCGRLPLLLPC